MSHSTQPGPESEAPVSQTDMEFMLLIIQGHASAYSIWSYMKENPKEYPRPTAYKNINQRLLRLARIGLLEGKVKFDTPESTHGRRDYKITMQGLERLIPYFMIYPKAFRGRQVVEYMKKTNLDLTVFGNLLVSRTVSMTSIVNEYNTFAELPGLAAVITPEVWVKLAEKQRETKIREKRVIPISGQELLEHLNPSSKVKSKGKKKPPSS